MKRRPFQSILTVLLSAGALGGIPCTAPLTYAATEDKGTTWWSVQELIEFNQEVEAEKQAECGDNQDCLMEWNFTMYEKGPKYAALENLLQSQIWITSVNPAAETIKVLFFDDDMMLRHMGVEEKLELEHLYIGWFDEWNGQIYNYDHDSFTNGSTLGSHTLYDSTMADISAIVPWKEVELSVAGGNLIDNHTGKLDYAVFAKYNMFNAQGHFDYSGCLNAPDYEAGMECQMMVSGDQWISYFPPREQIIEPLTVEDSTPEPEEPLVKPEGPTIDPGDITVEPDHIVTEPEDVIVELESTIDPMAESNNEWYQPQIIVKLTDSIVSSIKAPETGKSTNSSEQSLEMPWWLILLNIAGFLFIVWWFLPSRNVKTRRKFEKKVRENQEKLLTNSSKCDKMSTV